MRKILSLILAILIGVALLSSCQKPGDKSDSKLSGDQLQNDDEKYYTLDDFGAVVIGETTFIELC